MSEFPLVSVIITTYKRNNYLKRAIESVIHQTYTNLELLIVDDNDYQDVYSQSVEKIVLYYSKIFKNIKYLPMIHNSGACKARNYGIQIAQGTYINFLDDDDEFEPNKIELQVNKFKNLDNSYAAVGCFAVIKDKKGKIIRYDRNRIKGNVFFDNLCSSIAQTSLPLIRRESIIRSGGFEEIPSSQEHLMWANLFSICPNYDYVDKELVVIYHHDGERISNGDKKIEGAIELEKRFKKFNSQLNRQQITYLNLCLNKNIIYACVNVGNRKTAINYFKFRKQISPKISFEDLKIIIKIIIGNNIIKKVNIFKNKLYWI